MHSALQIIGAAQIVSIIDVPLYATPRVSFAPLPAGLM